MGFPITYQFCGSENSKLRLVGNAVCPAVSRGIAVKICQALNIQAESNPLIIKEPNLEGVFNLNTYSLKSFANPPVKKQGAKFRRHPFKGENMTVAMMNHDVDGKLDKKSPWKSIVFHGTGEGFVSKEFPIGIYKELEPIIEKNFSDGTRFIKIMNNGFSEKIADKRLMQKMYEIQKSQDNLLEPSVLIEELGRIIQTFDVQNKWFDDSEFSLFGKPKVPKKHLYALYGINKIITEANLK
jgi:DNA (cytosine-5)-methyltransferase 1